MNPPEEISGLIERVTFHNPDNGFAVLKVKTKGRRDLQSVLGEIPSVNAGEWLRAEGHWERSRDHGLQFRAQKMETVAPSTREGIERYLASGLIKGIGPVYAKKLVERFGEEVFDIIENTSARLETIDGIGPERRRRIKGAWNEQKSVREIMVFLHSHGVSSSRATRIYRTYGDEAIERVQSNPYILAQDIKGIGFQSADRIALNLGVPKDSLERAEAGARHILWEATQRGHCALPQEETKRLAAELLEIPESRIAEALERSIRARRLEPEQMNGEDLLFLPPLRNAELIFARAIRIRAKESPNLPHIDIEKAIPWAEKQAQVALAEGQKIALRHCLESKVSVITGGPGVGKTTMVRCLLSILTAKNVRFLLAAPTGRAARRLAESSGSPALTIHRLLEPKKGRFTRDEDNPLDTDALIVDEASMIDIQLAAHLAKAIPPRASVIFVGDVDQLPSVGPGSVLRDLIQSGVVPVGRLTEIFRQAAKSQIIATAHRVNQGLHPNFQKDNADNDLYFVEKPDPEAIAETLLRVVTERAPKRFGLDPINDIQVLCPMNRGSLGARELNTRLQSALNPHNPMKPEFEMFGSTYREGDKVIQTQNNYEKEVFNGDIGRILRIHGEDKELTVGFDDRKVRYEFNEMDELGLAYAITIHKSQGSEFPAVVIPLATQSYTLLQRNLIYTAITRGKRLVTIVGQSKALGIAIRNNEGQRRYSGLLGRLRSD